jgi:hypothetical protein
VARRECALAELARPPACLLLRDASKPRALLLERGSYATDARAECLATRAERRSSAGERALMLRITATLRSGASHAHALTAAASA